MLIFALVRLLLPAIMAIPWCNFMSEKYNALFFCLLQFVQSSLYASNSIVWSTTWKICVK